MAKTKNTWPAYFQVDGDGVTYYTTVDVPVPIRLYNKIQSAIKEGKALSSCAFYGELVRRAEDSFDLAECVGLNDEKPDPDDYEDRDEYRDALEEFRETVDALWDQYYLSGTNIFDPGDLQRFKNYFIGKSFESLKGDSTGTRSFNFEEEGERIVRYELTVCFDRTGTITDISRFSVNGLEKEGVSSSSWGDSYPNFSLLRDLLEDTYLYLWNWFYSF